MSASRQGYAFEPTPAETIEAGIIERLKAELPTSFRIEPFPDDPRRFDLAASWIDRRMNDLEARCKRIKSGSVARLDAVPSQLNIPMRPTTTKSRQRDETVAKEAVRS